MKSLLVIGGSGFFGKSILDTYRRGLLASWNISSISVLARHASSLRLSTPDLLGADIELIDEDISFCTSLPPADYVIHAAASTEAARYLSRPAQERANILEAISNYCQLAKRFHRDSKIVYVSSGAVYGQQNPLLLALKESDAGAPIEQMELGKQDYAAAKRDGEQLICDLAAAGCHVSIARCFSFVGPYLPQDQHFAIGNFIQDGLLGKAIEVKARQIVYRSYMYADDLVLWLMAILDISGKDCPIFNVGSNQAVEIGIVAEIISSIFGVSVHYSHIRSSEQDRYIPSIEKALGKGFKLNYSLEKAIEETIQRIRELNREQS